MSTLSSVQKDQLLSQVKRQVAKLDINQVVSLINKYDNLKKEEFESILSPEQYAQLLELFHDPEELRAWNELQTMSCSSIPEMQSTERKINDYIARYQMEEESHVNEAHTMLAKVRSDIADALEREREKKAYEEEQARLAREREREREAWERLDTSKYGELTKYLNRYPETTHRDEIDDLMWNIVTTNITNVKLSRYLSDMPDGRHVKEANDALDSYSTWEEIKRHGDILAVKDYIDNYPSSPFAREARNRYYDLRDEELTNMKANPAEYDIDRLQELFNSNIFSKEELMDEGLITEQSWTVLTEVDRNMLPQIDQTPDPNVTAPADCTDIFFFGTPSTGKTCLLMGLAGANGQEYSLNMVGRGGQYISDLTIYANTGITPKSTFGTFVTVINGTINETTPKGAIVRHNVNFVEMSGEEFAMRIAQNPDNKVSFEHMGTGATRLLMNNNRKVFFIIVDPTKNMIPFRYQQEVISDDGEKNTIIRKTYIAQDIILAKLTSLFLQPENARIMEKVDSIHFIVTKSDTLGDMRSDRNVKAGELLRANYAAAVGQLKDYIRLTQRINRSTGFGVNAYTFSLGRFYLGDIFEIDVADTRNLIETIRNVTFGHREQTVWDRVKKILN